MHELRDVSVQEPISFFSEKMPEQCMDVHCLTKS